ncbi:MAG: diaminopimelate epimerase, partial [Candidatus Omnitrophica bacterium]|nr:diaminopimelate epimerase [Candidatus Omnitrophota bacterium]
MKPIIFYKMQASGNDFVVIDNRKYLISNPKKFAQKICARQFGVGADGLLLVEPSRTADFRMRIINSDGSQADMCGNRSRCITLFAQKILGLKA